MKEWGIIGMICALAIGGVLLIAQSAEQPRRNSGAIPGLPIGGQFQPRRNGVPRWQLDSELPNDVFTFVRVRYTSYGGRGRKWATDYPDADLNFSYRLQELTSLKVDPDGRVLELTNPQLFNYPFIYMSEPGDLYFDDAEVKALRKYLLNGGFMMVDDFWGGDEYDNFAAEMKRVFPKREPKELPLEHPIFHNVFNLKERPQVPSIGPATNGQMFEWRPGPDDGSEVHYRGLFDDEGRLMVIICHNTDLADGWEREGENHYYFKTFSEPKAYPMGINIIIYAMTH